jgi:pimeloyl-ACP methyl ester carboxylesterase
LKPAHPAKAQVQKKQTKIKTNPTLEPKSNQPNPRAKIKLNPTKVKRSTAMIHRWIAGIPVLQFKCSDIEPYNYFDARVPRQALLVLHRLEGSKKQMADLEHFRQMAHADLDVFFVDLSWHGERNLFDVAAFMLQNSRESYFWGSLLESCLTFHGLLDTLEFEGYQDFLLLGHELGGNIAHWLLANDARVSSAVILGGKSQWQPRGLKAARLAEWVCENSPHLQFKQLPPKPLCIIENHDALEQDPGYTELKAAYERAGCADLLEYLVLPNFEPSINTHINSAGSSSSAGISEVMQEHAAHFFSKVAQAAD